MFQKMKSLKPKANSRLSPAYTVIEVLVSMALIVLIAMIVSNVFYSGSESWNIGTRSAEINTVGRSALDFMANELRQAVAGPIESDEAQSASNMPFRVKSDGSLAFLTLSQDPSSETRALRGVFLWKDGYGLKYDRLTKSLECYSSKWSQNYHSSDLICDNVTDLQFFVYKTADDLRNALPCTGDLNELPFCVDVFLELMSDSDMARYNAMAGPEKAQFMDRNAKAFSTRVYFCNRQGYSERE